MFTALLLSVSSDGGLTPAIEKLAALDDGEHGCGEFASVAGECILHFEDERFITRQRLATQGITEKFTAELGGEVGLVLFEVATEAFEALEPGAIFELAGIINVCLCAEATDGIKALQGKAEGVNAIMTNGAGLIRAVLHERLTQGGWLTGFFELGDVGRWRRRAEPEDDLIQVVSPKHGAGAAGTRGLGQNGTHAQEASAMMLGDFDLTKVIPDDVGDTVMPTEALIHEAVVAGDDVRDIAILTHEMREKLNNLTLHVSTQFRGELGKGFFIDAAFFIEATELEPLTRELLGQSGGF